MLSADAARSPAEPLLASARLDSLTSPSPGAPRHLIPGVTHVWQKWNNCGPSAVLMAMSAHGLRLGQAEVAAEIKPDREDTNVTPEELADYARRYGLTARARLGGDRDIARALVRAGVPVVAEQWIDVEGRGEMGHYRVVVGFDDDAGVFIAQDSYYGPRRRFSYEEFERMWQPFLGAYVVSYLPEQEQAVVAAVGGDWDDGAMWSRALAVAAGQAEAAPGDAWSWFALGEARTATGDHAGAVDAFDRAREIGLPYRAFWYQFGYYRSLVETGAFERVVAHADQTVATMGGENLEESHYWRGVALTRLGRGAEAADSFQTALRYNPRYAPALEALGGSP
jgi:tetratricopeptide (TPR) repeat protein